MPCEALKKKGAKSMERDMGCFLESEKMIPLKIYMDFDILLESTRTQMMSSTQPAAGSSSKAPRSSLGCGLSRSSPSSVPRISVMTW